MAEEKSKWIEMFVTGIAGGGGKGSGSRSGPSHTQSFPVEEFGLDVMKAVFVDGRLPSGDRLATGAT